MPSLIMKRVREASGSKYSVHNEPSKRPEPIAPVGTNYTPVGKVDMASLRAAAPPKAPTGTTTARVSFLPPSVLSVAVLIQGSLYRHHPIRLQQRYLPSSSPMSSRLLLLGRTKRQPQPLLPHLPQLCPVPYVIS